ncbi:fibropellin-3-like [Antedon mediterranea]|uniref:fibropellin-3-like n=1 Tax=Antedon mediterranea TaxID=105859 RepID=UPI003AF81AC6
MSNFWIHVQFCRLCKTTATGCQSNPCFNGGACVAFLSGAFVCKCPTGFSGVNCENLYASEACAVNQCGNNLACYNRNEPNQPNYVCECTQPNTGSGYNCQTTTANSDIFTCYGSKCFYGTFSSPNYPNMYVARYSALYLLYAPNVDRIDMFFDNIFNVERPKDELYIGAGLTSLDIGSLTGQHISSLNMFYFDGSQRPGKISIVSDSAWMYFLTDKNVEQSGFRIRWEMYINPCNNLLCQNGGTCQLDATRKIGTCLCLSCYVGSVCETALNACSNNFCQNGAACVQAGSSCTEYTCVCLGNYNGTFCETSLSRLMASSVSPFPVDSTVTDSDTDNCTFTVQVIEGSIIPRRTSERMIPQR